MGNFDDHMQYGYAAYLLFAASLVGAVLSGGLAPLKAIGIGAIGYPLVMLGATFPDIDHHASHPHRAFKRVVFLCSIVGTFTALSLFAFDPLVVLVLPHAPAIADTIVMVVFHIVALASGSVSVWIVTNFRPRHRGVTHKIPTGLILSGTIGVCIWYLSQFITAIDGTLFGVFLGGAFLLGFMSHLQCDSMLFSAITSLPSRARQTISEIKSSTNQALK